MMTRFRSSRSTLGAVVVLTLATGAASCGGSSETIQITGAGATFPYPLYSRWFSEYNQLHPDVQINYQSQGSGAGIRQLTNGTVFFGASDGPMTEAQLEAAPGLVMHFPTVLGAVVPIYNLPSVTGDLRFSGEVLADIFLGDITRWNDPAIASLNPGVTLPDRDITVVHRSDGSGTTFVWVDFLSKVSPAWTERVGVGTAVDWPVGVGAKGNEGMAGLIKQTEGTIGYTEPAYANQNDLAYGAVQNEAGEFVVASPDSVSAAAAGAVANMPADFRVSITNAPGASSYPIASFTWILLFEDATNKAQARVMVDFMTWALHDGQQFAAELGYAPLPPSVVELEMEALKRIRVE